jgi:hypothetical protein
LNARYFAVYRICFALACFFFLFMIIMVYVRSSRDPRAYIQNGFWFFKALALIGLLVGAFYIPRNGAFEEVFMYFGLVGGFLFIVIQLILIIDFVHSWNESWVEKFENGQREYYYGLLFFTVFFYAAAITVVVLGYIFYASVSTLLSHHIKYQIIRFQNNHLIHLKHLKYYNHSNSLSCFSPFLCIRS